jgi:2-oxoglutarate ferredoxin oxidoreductase subunit delta
MSEDETAEESAVQVSQAAKAGPRRPRGYVTLFGTWCKGCGLCSEFCPQGVLVADAQGRPRVAHPELCTACHWCDSHCPDMAITVRRLEPEEIEGLEALAALAAQGAPAQGEK